MASDYGDEAGEKLFDWLMQVGERAGEDAMTRAADRFSTALQHAKEGKEPETQVDEKGVEWAKLDLAEFKEVEGYESLREIIDTKLKAEGIEHAFFEDEQADKDYLIFRLEDAPQVWDAFSDLQQQNTQLQEQAREALAAARGQRTPEREQSRSTDAKTAAKARDAQPLDERAKDARKGAAAIEAERTKTPEGAREVRFQENRSK
jgi:hypothetical protein